MFFYIKGSKSKGSCVSNEKGAVLLYCMIVLLVLTTLGIMAHQSSVTEARIAVNEQRWEKDFNVSEGGASVEASNVGYARDGTNEWFEITDPGASNQFLIPPDSGTYDPGGDIVISGTFPEAFEALPATDKAVDHRYWPRQNLTQSVTDDLFDYAYMVTYVGASEKGIKGYDAGSFAAYQFRINSRQTADIEMGGYKIGVKPM